MSSMRAKYSSKHIEVSFKKIMEHWKYSYGYNKRFTV